MRNTIIGGIIIAVASFFIQRAYFTDRPDIIYSLSNEIYTSLLESENREVIQQLTIKNIGTLGAERVVIAINGNVSSYDIGKYSETDSIKVVSTKTNFELIYPLLPPDGQIEILIKNLQKGIKKENLTVKHNSGLGKEAFQKSSSLSLLTLVPLFLGIVFLFANVYDHYKDSFQSDINYNPIDKILKRPKPFLLSTFKWSEFRKAALENFFDKDRAFTKINDLICWQVISNDKPTYLTHDEWTKVLNDAIKKFKEVFTEKLVTRSYLTLNDELFAIEKPKQFGISDWKEVVDLINNYYIFHSLTKQRLIWINGFSEEIKKHKPDLIETDVDKKYKSILREIFFSKFVSRITRLRGLGDYHQEYDISLLSDDQQREIKEILDGLIDLKKATQYMLKLREVVNVQLKEKDNDLIDKEDWEKLTELSHKISKILENKEQAEEDRIKFDKLRNRVEKQLDIIDRIISNPDYVTKIEDYNDVFNTGNLKNLLKISAVLKERGDGNKI